MEKRRFYLLVLHLTISFLTDEGTGQRPVYLINIATDNADVAEGEAFYFQCNTHENVTGIQLVIDGQLDYGPKFNRIIVDSAANDSANFTFVNVSRSDQGTEFQCYAVYAQRGGDTPPAIESAPLYFNVEYPPSYSVPTKVYYSYAGTINGQRFTVLLDGNPYPVNYTWFHNGVAINDATNRNVMLSASSIAFSILQLSNNGTYTVEAANFLGMATATFELVVYSSIPTTTLTTTLPTSVTITTTTTTTARSPSTTTTARSPATTTTSSPSSSTSSSSPSSFTSSSSTSSTLSSTSSHSSSFTTTALPTTSTSNGTSSSAPSSSSTSGSANPSVTSQPVPKRSNAGAIAAAILVPFFILVVVMLSATLFYFCYWRKRSKFIHLSGASNYEELLSKEDEK